MAPKFDGCAFRVFSSRCTVEYECVKAAQDCWLEVKASGGRGDESPLATRPRWCYCRTRVTRLGAGLHCSVHWLSFDLLFLLPSRCMSRTMVVESLLPLWSGRRSCGRRVTAPALVVEYMPQRRSSACCRSQLVFEYVAFPENEYVAPAPSAAVPSRVVECVVAPESVGCAALVVGFAPLQAVLQLQCWWWC